MNTQKSRTFGAAFDLLLQSVEKADDGPTVTGGSDDAGDVEADENDG
jgi:hypothetical protein